jgi:uncharacterized membrane protein
MLGDQNGTARGVATAMFGGDYRTFMFAGANEMTDSAIVVGIHWITRFIEMIGTGIIVVGAGRSLFKFVLQLARQTIDTRAIGNFRSDLGEAILLGLEFLVAADIINTVAIQPTINSLLVLAGIVLIRTFLGFSLEVEIKGRWPWQRHSGEKLGSSG